MIVQQLQPFTHFDGTYGVCAKTECGRLFITWCNSLWSQTSFINFFEQGNGLFISEHDTENWTEIEETKD